MSDTDCCQSCRAYEAARIIRVTREQLDRIDARDDVPEGLRALVEGAGGGLLER